MTIEDELRLGIKEHVKSREIWDSQSAKHDAARKQLIAENTMQLAKISDEVEPLKRGIINHHRSLCLFSGSLVNCYNAGGASIIRPKDDMVDHASSEVTKSGAHYIHFKLSGIANKASVMVKLGVEGQEYGANEDISISGSCYSYGVYSGSNSKIHSQNFSRNSHSAIFYKTPTGTYLRLTLKSAYYFSINIESYSTNLGTNIGPVKAIFSTRETL